MEKEGDHTEDPLNTSFHELSLTNSSVSTDTPNSGARSMNSISTTNSVNIVKSRFSAGKHSEGNATFIQTKINDGVSVSQSKNAAGQKMLSADDRTNLTLNNVDTSATSITDMTESIRKRKRSAQDNFVSTINCPIKPLNPAINIAKHVTFSFQNNHNEDAVPNDTARTPSQTAVTTSPGTSTAPDTMDTTGAGHSTPAQHAGSPPSSPPPDEGAPTGLSTAPPQDGEEALEMEQDLMEPAPPEDPSRTYRVIDAASDMWKLSMTHRRTAARDHARICQLNRCLQKENLPLWTYGISQAPDWLRPMPSELVHLLHQQARAITELTRNLLRVSMANSERLANRHLAHTRQAYEEEDDTDFPLAETRLNGIINHYRSKEQSTLQRQMTADDNSRPTNPNAWADALPKRKVPPTPAATTSTSRGARARSRSRSRSRNGGNARGRARSNRPNPRLQTNQQGAPPSREASQERAPTGGSGRGKNKPSNRKRAAPQTLTADEHAIIAALRAQKAAKKQ